ncbi:MAG TPA: hypothetical protein VFB50_02025, partial [Chloroflexota bacterium]|nr:hypothetical protein [Chloroflexota bacterium]
MSSLPTATRPSSLQSPVLHSAVDRTRVAPLLALSAFGIATVAIYTVVFLRAYPLAEWWQYALADFGTISGYDLSAQLAFLGGFAALFGLCYGAAEIVHRWRPRGALPVILLFQVLAGLPLIGIYPIAALDVFDYVIYARMALYWGANPFIVTPSALPNEPTVGFSYWQNEPSVYGPLWQALSERVVAIANGQVLEGLVAFKSVALAAAVLTTLLVWLILRRLRPEFADVGALFWAWNPLQMFESAGNAHNDSVMVLLLVVAIFCMVYGPRLLTLPVLAASLLIKVTLAPLVPVFVVASLLGNGPPSRRVVRLLASASLAVAVVVVSYAPYWVGRASLPFMDRGNWFTASPPTLVRELFRQWFDFDVAGQRAALLCGAGFALITLVVLARLVRRASQADGTSRDLMVIRAAYVVFFAYLVVACLWWQPWYLLALLCLAVITGDRVLIDRANLFCIGGLLSYVAYKYIWQVHQGDWQLDYLRIQVLFVVAIFTLPLLHLA